MAQLEALSILFLTFLTLDTQALQMSTDELL
jgi:hypothetical protein